MAWALKNGTLAIRPQSHNPPTPAPSRPLSSHHPLSSNIPNSFTPSSSSHTGATSFPETRTSQDPEPIPTRRIIASEDSERQVEDVDSECLSGEGLGADEDDHADEGDGDGSGPGDSARPPRVRKPTPFWVQTAFTSVLEEYVKKKNAEGMSVLYARHQTFWIPQKSTWFSLHASTPNPATLFNNRFFYWDPEQLVVGGISCPNTECNTRLQRHGLLNRPRRVVELEGQFWLIGERYRCRSCSVTFSSWDPRIMAKLPKALQMEFPAHLTHRSGVSTQVFALIRTCIQRGFGSKALSDTLRVLHQRRFDLHHLQYLEFLKAGVALSQWRGQTFPPFGAFTDLNGYGGFVPSAHYLRDLYDDFIEQHEAELSQAISMLSADIAALDHSHKVRTPLVTISISDIPATIDYEAHRPCRRCRVLQGSPHCHK